MRGLSLRRVVAMGFVAVGIVIHGFGAWIILIARFKGGRRDVGVVE